MTFDDLISLQPSIRLADLIQLFLLVYDDKIYINVIIYKANSKEPIELYEIRIIDSALKPYYEYEIEYLCDTYFENPGSMMTVALKES